MTAAAKTQLKQDTLPEWDLRDLYPAMDAPQIEADKKALAAEAKAFSARYKGKLAEAAPDQLAEAIAAYESFADRIGRLSSFAGLIYAGNNDDPERAKFYGDVQDFITKTYGDLLFFELELNRIDEGVMQKALHFFAKAGALCALARGSPPREAAPVV